MTPNEQQRQNMNRSLAVQLAGSWSDGITHTRDEVWDAFIDFYTRLDKHNCPHNPENEPLTLAEVKKKIKSNSFVANYPSAWQSPALPPMPSAKPSWTWVGKGSLGDAVASDAAEISKDMLY